MSFEEKRSEGGREAIRAPMAEMRFRVENSATSSLPVERGVKTVMMAGLLRSMSLGGEIV